MTSVELKNIRKTYDGNTEIIKGVNLEVQSGEFLVLVGPSGCGKSTLLRLIAGLEEITSGDLLIGDRVVNDVPPRDRGIGMVFQSYALYPHMTVRENMAFGLKIRKLDQRLIDERVEAASKQLDLEAYLDRYPKQLSGGQRQRVAMGRAIVRQPDVFLFDEPLSNLDAALRTQMRVELKKLHRRLGATMIYVTHDQVEAMTLANRITILNLGHIQQVGTPDEVYNKPANKFVAGFIGSPSMNFFEGKHTGGWIEGPHFKFPAPTGDVATIGARPQHLQIFKEGAHVPDGFGALEGVVDVIEPMGWEAYVHVHVGALPVIAHVETEQLGGLAAGDQITLAIEPDKIHAFDTSGNRIDT